MTKTRQVKKLKDMTDLELIREVLSLRSQLAHRTNEKNKLEKENERLTRMVNTRESQLTLSLSNNRAFQEQARESKEKLLAIDNVLKGKLVIPDALR